MLSRRAHRIANGWLRLNTSKQESKKVRVGQFVDGKKAQEIILVSSSHLLMFYIDQETGKIYNKLTQNLFAVVNKVDKIRLGNIKDGLVMTSDSGNLSVLEYDEKLNKFRSIVQQPMTKNGWNKTYPGEYLVVEPQSRCILVGAMEKIKLLYRINAATEELEELESRSQRSSRLQEEEEGEENGQPRLEISSPVELNTKHLLCLNIVALHTEYENPLFCAIEYNPEDKRTLLNYYMFDQGLNYMVKRKVPNPELPDDSNYLIPVAGSIGGVLICGENWIRYEKLDVCSLVLPLPRRENQNTTIVGHVSHMFKKKGMYIFLQSTHGDLFKLVINYDSGRAIVKDITITYFDTISPCHNISMIKGGFLFANTLNNNQYLYQFDKLGEETREGDLIIESSLTQKESMTPNSAKLLNMNFKVKELENLILIDTLESLSPITDSRLLPHSRIAALSTNANMKTIVRGMPTATLVESPLAFSPTDVFTTKLTGQSENDEYLVLTSTLASKTLVLSIGETLEDVNDSEFILDQPTIAVQQVGKSSLVQVYTNGIRHVTPTSQTTTTTRTKSKKTTDWYPPAGISITHAATNNHQILLALSNSEVVYFETDPIDDQLVEYQDKLEISSPVTSMTISQNRSSFAVIGCSDETVQVISLQSQSCLEIKSLQALSSKASSLAMMSYQHATFVHIGMENGIYAKARIDQFSGKLSDTRVKYLGSRAISLRLIKLSDEIEGILAISSQAWIAYHYQGSFKITQLLNINIESGASLVSEDVGGEAIVGTRGHNLLIFSVGQEDSAFDPNQDLTIETLKLRYMPRKMISFDTRLYVSEVGVGVKTPYQQSLTKDVDDKVDTTYYEKFGYELSKNNCASCCQVVQNGQVKHTFEFYKNEQIIDMAIAHFNKNNYLVVGVKNVVDAKNLLYTFKLDRKKSLQYTHKTELDYFPQVIEFFNDRVLIGSDNTLSLYEMGQRQLLRKSFTRFDFLKKINKILPSVQNRIIIADLQSGSSLLFAKFDADENQFVPVADAIIKRNITSIAKLDYDTVIMGDKFGQMAISRIEEVDSRKIDQEWSIVKQQTQDSSSINSCIFKLRDLCEFYIPDIITSFQMSDSSSTEGSILYMGLQGTLGVMIPLLTKSEIELLFNLQLEMRKLCNPDDKKTMAVARWLSPLGKDHIKHRSYYQPVKNVIDGDFVENFTCLDHGWKLRISQSLNRSINEIEKKLHDVRNRPTF
ncbi:RSE1 [Candida oxycetoniae]|uniref:RSE1 n=1 Tax=Candida oxycetoniae TaxID=497107 RepID=A0AAI9ST84_9ASCO|nr:RSE1 [Candida oxycetoniae]KAI3402520.2 RSE1 [Candida oxycetoniae]